jgi:hypothetical protein
MAAAAETTFSSAIFKLERLGRDAAVAASLSSSAYPILAPKTLDLSRFLLAGRFPLA